MAERKPAPIPIEVETNHPEDIEKEVHKENEKSALTTWQDFCEVSSIHGIAHVISRDPSPSTQKRWRQLLWILICMALFGYLISELQDTLKG